MMRNVNVQTVLRLRAFVKNVSKSTYMNEKSLSSIPLEAKIVVTLIGLALIVVLIVDYMGQSFYRVLT